MKKKTKAEQNKFTKDLTALCEKFAGAKKENPYRTVYSIKTAAGTLTVTFDDDNSIMFTIFAKFEDDFDNEVFMRRIGTHTGINPYSFKYNIHNDDAVEALRIFERRLELLTEKELEYENRS